MLHLIGLEIYPRTSEFSNILFHHIRYVFIKLLGTLNLLIDGLPQLITRLRPKIPNLPVLRIPLPLFHNIMAIHKQRAHIRLVPLQRIFSTFMKLTQSDKHHGLDKLWGEFLVLGWWEEAEVGLAVEAYCFAVL